jgi:hypothetical protein
MLTRRTGARAIQSKLSSRLPILSPPRAREGGALMMAAVGRRRREVRDARVSNPIQQLCRGILFVAYSFRSAPRRTKSTAGARDSILVEKVELGR